MNTFGKMGLLCCLAAVLLAGCGDGDRDASAAALTRKNGFALLSGGGFACRMRWRGQRYVGGSAHKKKEEVQQIKYTKSDTLPETAERKEYDEKAA